MRFGKWHGAGNAYLVIEAADAPVDLTPARVARICHPDLGAGSDGILVVSGRTVRILNPDGSDAEFSGNGSRIAAAHIAARDACTELELVAQACRDHPRTFIGFGSVDPLKGARAVEELNTISELGLKGVKLHPSLQAFAPDDEKHWPLYERCEELGLAVLFHTGTSGIGAGQPGGQGIRLDYARPIRLDAVAASFPSLNVIAAHFGYPWHLELLAMALHKTNLYIDISGWAPRYIPAEVIRDLKGRLQNQFVFGSDYPFIQPKRCLDELQELGIGDEALQKVLVGNGKRLLGLS